jgi:hypothetical protein
MPKQGATIKVGSNTRAGKEKDFAASGIEGTKGTDKTQEGNKHG